MGKLILGIFSFLTLKVNNVHGVILDKTLATY